MGRRSKHGPYQREPSSKGGGRRTPAVSFLATRAVPGWPPRQQRPHPGLNPSDAMVFTRSP
ncbi:hypothetical protein D7W81_29425 [Corallococcus aberystwythensis]|uniref:Uncharacterized protein n=1 Tax=Corallococcus aberystwythensis TaxID=2316722 RepID=A0A3A8PPC1_9BACT|nr:hypothetical protein D7W81_29425 [Corallococcus aberystwythensis]